MEHVVCISLISKQLRDITPQVDEPLANLKVVLVVVVNALGVASHIYLLTQFALGAIGDKRGVARIVKCENPTFFASILSGLCGSLACRFGQTVELCFIGDVQLESLILFQQVL